LFVYIVGTTSQSIGTEVKQQVGAFLHYVNNGAQINPETICSRPNFGQIAEVSKSRRSPTDPPPTICLKSGSSSEDQEGQVSHVGGFVPLLCEELLVCRGNRRLPDSSRSFVWRVPCGVWRVACCVRRVACGVWRVTCGVWRGRNKDKDMDRDNDMDCKLGIVMHTFQRALCCFHDGGLCFPSV
jgi:hypothetical protein